MNQNKNLRINFSGQNLQDNQEYFVHKNSTKKNSFKTPQHKGYIRENNYNEKFIPKIKNINSFNNPIINNIQNFSGKHYFGHKSKKTLNEEFNEQSTINGSQRIHTDHLLIGNNTNRSLSTTQYQHSKQWGVSEGKDKLASKKSDLKEYQDHRKLFHQSQKRIKKEIDINSIKDSKNSTKSFGFFNKFAKNNNSMNYTLYNNKSQNFSQNEEYDYTQPMATFNYRIQGDKIDKNIGILSNNNLKQEILNKTISKFNSGIDPKLQNLRDELYKEEEIMEQMPDDMRVKSELFLNQFYKNQKQEQINKKQQQESHKLYNTILDEHKTFQNIDRFVSVKRHKPPQIGEDSNQIEVTKKKQGKNNFLSHSASKNMNDANNGSQNNRNSLLLKQMQIQPSLNVHIRFYESNVDWHPSGRIGCTVSAVNGHIFVIGGRLNELISDVAMLKIQKHHNYENKWMSLSLFEKLGYQQDQKLLSNCKHLIQKQKKEEEQMKTRKLTKLQTLKSFVKQVNHTTESKDEFTGRFNHSAIVWKKYIVVFGGEQEFDMRYKKRSVLNEVFFYDSVEQTWQKKVTRGDAVESRRNHTANILGNDMVVLGGLNAFEKVPNELVYLDLHELKWKTYGEQGNYKHIFQESGSLCYHASASVYEDPQRQKLHAEKNFMYHPLIREQGIYYYGGKFPNNKINNDVYLLSTFSFPVKWKIIQTQGQKPTKRYQHGMQYDQTQKVLIICGGKTEQKDISYLNDIWILKLQNYQWMQINCINPDNIRYNSNFGSTMYESQLFIFGGMNQNGFTSGTLEIHEYDQKRVQQIKSGKDFTKKEVQGEEETKEIQEKKRKQGLGTTYKSYQPIPPEIIQQKQSHLPRLSKLRSSIKPIEYEDNTFDEDSDEYQIKSTKNIVTFKTNK